MAQDYIYQAMNSIVARRVGRRPRNPDEQLPSLRGVRAFVTGHTGSKGSWLCAWLKRRRSGSSGPCPRAEPNGQPNLFEAAAVARGMRSSIGDIRDFELVEREIGDFQPDIVFHLAAQPLVRRSYHDPLGTFSTNVMGTAHVLEAARRCRSVRAIVCVTTDKVYANKEWVWGYQRGRSARRRRSLQRQQGGGRDRGRILSPQLAGAQRQPRRARHRARRQCDRRRRLVAKQHVGV